MAPRLALAAVALLALSAARLRAWLERPAPEPAVCAPEGRGVPPRHWLGCAGDPGPPRGLGGDERLVLGLPLDPNQATSRELACVPGLSRALAAEIVADRERRGPFPSVEDLGRVRGIGPRRLATAATHLSVPPGVAAPRPLR
jgi:competence protein ComEA